MLNRRTLRIKIMQSLFAFEQCKEADYELALDHINEFFKPDLNSMKVQDKDLLKDQRGVATKLFQKRFKGNKSAESSDPRIAQSVDEALSLYFKLKKRDFDHFRKNIAGEVQRIQEFYLAILNLIILFADSALSDKKLAAGNIKANPLLVAIRNNGDLKKQSAQTTISWGQQTDRVRDWFRDCIKADKEFKSYLDVPQPDEETHRSFVKYLIRKLILGNTPINAYFEEEDLRWAEDHEIVKSMLDKTLKSFDGSDITIQKLSMDWEEDKIFIERLYKVAGELEQPYQEMIAANTRNWEVDRLPLTDRVILHLAIAELINFPNIPVKVTINEYIELAKQYSTPKSRQFINGILDVIAKELMDSGKIKKSGRGLLDNK